MEQQPAEQGHNASSTFKYEDKSSEAQDVKISDVGVGQIVSVHATPEQEKRVVMKLDVM